MAVTCEELEGRLGGRHTDAQVCHVRTLPVRCADHVPGRMHAQGGLACERAGDMLLLRQ